MSMACTQWNLITSNWGPISANFVRCHHNIFIIKSWMTHYINCYKLECICVFLVEIASIGWKFSKSIEITNHITMYRFELVSIAFQFFWNHKNHLLFFFLPKTVLPEHLKNWKPPLPSFLVCSPRGCSSWCWPTPSLRWFPFRSRCSHRQTHRAGSTAWPCCRPRTADPG